MFGVLYEVDTTTSPMGFILIDQTDDYTIQQADTNNWVTIPFNSAISIDPQFGQQYMIAIGGYAHPLDTFGINVSGDAEVTMSRIQDNGCNLGSQGFGYWYWVPETPMVRMNFGNVIQPTWDCVNGSCIDPGTGNGTYASLSACQTNCITPTWDCVNNSCIDPGTGNGQYSTYSACTTACVVVNPTWDCVNGSCIDPGTGNGTYASLSACQTNCVQTSIYVEGIVSFNIFPNPTEALINIKFSVENNQNVTLRLFNNIGEVLYEDILEQFIGEYTKQIDLTTNAKGIYFLEIETDDGVINKKLMLQ